MIEIQVQCSSHYTGEIIWFACTRSIFAILLCLGVIIFSIYLMFKMHKFMKRLSFEIIPLTTTFL